MIQGFNTHLGGVKALLNDYITEADTLGTRGSGKSSAEGSRRKEGRKEGHAVIKQEQIIMEMIENCDTCNTEEDCE